MTSGSLHRLLCRGQVSGPCAFVLGRPDERCRDRPLEVDIPIVECPLPSLRDFDIKETLAKLDEMIRLLRPWDGDTQRAFVMNRGRYAKFVALCHAAGFDPAIVPDRILGKPLAHYMGVPVLVSDFITDTETLVTTSVYLACLGTREGEPQFGGLVWFYNRDTGPGIRVDGPHRTSGTTDLLFSTLELNIGFASLSTGSVLRMSSVGLS